MIFSFPPLPASEALHPLIVHLPIGALAVAPLLILLAMFATRMRQPLSIAALLILVLGTAGAFAATFSGENAQHAAFIPPQAKAVMENHEELGELARNLFATLTALYAAVFLIAVVRGEKFGRTPWIIAHAVCLAFYVVCFVQLANAGHLGGRLVHEFGVRAPLVGPPAGTPT